MSADSVLAVLGRLVAFWVPGKRPCWTKATSPTLINVGGVGLSAGLLGRASACWLRRLFGGGADCRRYSER